MAKSKTKPTDPDAELEAQGFAPITDLSGEGPRAAPEGPAPRAERDDDTTAQKRTEELAALERAGANVAPLFAEGKQPKFGTARRAADLPAPRVAHQLERAGDGLSRFKLRAEVPGGNAPVKYVLAADAEEAESFYRAKFKLPDEARVILTELPD